MPPAALSWRSAQTPLPPASTASSPTQCSNPPHQVLYHCCWLLQRFPNLCSVRSIILNTGPSSRSGTPKPQAATLSSVTVKSSSNIAEMRRSGLSEGIAISNDSKTPSHTWPLRSVRQSLSDERKITTRHCRKIAEKVRQLARQTTIAEIQEELFDLVDRLEGIGETDP